MTTPNEEVQARLPELPVEAWNAAPGRLYTAEQLQDYAIAALARQEEGREAIETNYGSASGGAGDGRASGSTPQAQGYANGFDSRRSRPAPPSAGEGDALLTECYMAMQAAMNVIDVNEGPGLEHSRVVNALADCRIKIEQRNASRRLATPTPQSGEADATLPHERALSALIDLIVPGLDSGNILADAQAAMKAFTERGAELTDSHIQRVPDKCDRIIWRGHYFHLPETMGGHVTPAPASPQGVSEELAGLFIASLGDIPDDYSKITTEQVIAAIKQNLPDYPNALTAAGAAPEGWPERFACNGPEGTFWTDDAELANKLIRATFDRDEWTVTDTQHLGAQHGQEG